jgi:hypothetical protein
MNLMKTTLLVLGAATLTFPAVAAKKSQVGSLLIYA